MRVPLKWLEKELPEMERQGFLLPEQSRKILQHYQQQPTGSRGVMFVLFGVLGALLIGGGLMLIIAHNWSELSRPMRTFISIMPLVLTQALAGWVLLARASSIAWRESVGVIWMLSIGAAIAMVGQTYHMPGSFDSFMLTWMLLALPVIYLLRTSTALLMYLAGITSWAIDTKFSTGSSGGYWLLILAVLPLIIFWNRTAPFGGQATLSRWSLFTCAFIGLATVVNFDSGFLCFSLYSGYASLLYLAGCRYETGAPSAWQKPGSIVGGLGVAVCAYMFTCISFWTEMIGQTSVMSDFKAMPTVGAVVYVVILLAYAIYLGFAIVSRRILSIVWGVIPLVFFAGYVVLQSKTMLLPVVWIMNVALFAAGVITLVQGMKYEQLSRINNGMAVIGLLIVTRFFDGEFSILVRAAVFIVMGIAFLGVNMRMMRKRRAVPA